LARLDAAATPPRPVNRRPHARSAAQHTTHHQIGVAAPATQLGLPVRRVRVGVGVYDRAGLAAGR
ncbi:MAG TPA: hypothetical protein VGR74_21545, partial [Actinomycetota bacterium]|nr:hypothetical protein [Actinomycetota bacterium]